MKHIKLYEQFGEINEAEKKLSGGYINSHIASDSDKQYLAKKGDVVFRTDLSGEYPGDLELEKYLGDSYLMLKFPNSETNPQFINFKKNEPKPVDGYGTILAKNPAEAQSKALDILLTANFLANGSYESKEIGNLVKAFVEIQKMYPEYMRLNSLFGGFFKGLTTCWINPKFGSELGIDDYAGGFKKMLSEEIKKALQEKGVLK